MRLLKVGLLLLLAALLPGCATDLKKGDKLREAEYAYSAAIRWGDFEGAWNLLDPEYRKAHPMTDLEFTRYKQVQISGYTEIASKEEDDAAMREIAIGVINRNTLVERQARYTESWRYDTEAKTWWVTGGLPDLWQSE